MIVDESHNSERLRLDYMANGGPKVHLRALRRASDAFTRQSFTLDVKRAPSISRTGRRRRIRGHAVHAQWNRRVRNPRRSRRRIMGR